MVQCFACLLCSGLSQSLHSAGSDPAARLSWLLSCCSPTGEPQCGASLSDPNKALKINLNSNANCLWHIQRSENQTIRLIFSYFK